MGVMQAEVPWPSTPIWSEMRFPHTLPQQLHMPLLSVPTLLGISRCVHLRVACRDWAAACSANIFAPPAGFEEVFSRRNPDGDVWARRLACMTMIHVLGAPNFHQRPLAVVEDDVHWLLAHQGTKKWTGKMLQSSFRISGAENIAKFTASLQPKCKLPGVVLDVIFQLRSQVRLQLQPLHCAALLSSPSLVRKLLSISKHLGTLSDYTTESSSTEPSHSTISPLFLAVLFANQDVVDILKSYGACLNCVDAMATVRLQVAFLWADLEERLLHLKLDAEAEKLGKEVDELRRQATAQATDLDNAVQNAVAMDAMNMPDL